MIPSSQPILARCREADGLWLSSISAVLLLTLLPFSSYIVSLPLIQAEWQMNNSQAAMVFSSYLLGNAISALVLVPLTDRLAPERVYLGGVLVLTASNLLFPLLAWDPWVGSLLRVAAGVGHVGAYIPGVQLVSGRFAGKRHSTVRRGTVRRGTVRRGTAVGIFVSAGYAGTTISYTFMGLLLNISPTWRTAYFITALVGLAGLGLAFLLMWGAKPRPDGAASEPDRSAATGRKVWINLGVLRNRVILLLIVAYTLHTAELYIARLWFPSLLGAELASQGMASLEATALAATLSGFMFMMGIAGVFAGGFLSDHLGRSMGAALIFSLSGLCSFVAGWLLGGPAFWMIGLGFVYGFMTAADSAIYSTAATELAPPDRVGSTQALQSFIGFAVGAVLPVVAGFILDLMPSGAAWGWAFSFNGLLALLGVIALLWLRRLPESTRMAGGRR
jgi:MFS family permease